MKKIIITGAAGLVGMNLLSMMDRNKYRIIVIDKIKENLFLAKRLFPEIEIVGADLSQLGGWQQEFKGANTVIQLQAQISSPLESPYIKNNILSVKNVVEVCEENKVKNLIHFSSSVVISAASDNYTHTKKNGERIVAESKVPHTILRPPLMYGCFDVKHLGFLTRLLEVSPIFPVPGNGKYMRQPLFVEDICRIVIKLIELKPKNKVFNVIGKERIDWIDLMKMISQEKKIKRVYLNIPIPFFLFLIRTYGLMTGSKPFVPDQLKALMAKDDFPVTDWDKEFKVNYTPFREGIRKMLHSKYYKYRSEMKRPE